ncbi:hypothetical protein HPP92_006573 [Vanilla planifolia]|uniref:Uncharacterized protein n=1 Tax=Vanilla planifolia TaxID=51239 RepID=A0A835RJ01_VANPL|nr:hypothetical protein HPP92_006573 [Vanilla planifolia]
MPANQCVVYLPPHFKAEKAPWGPCSPNLEACQRKEAAGIPFCSSKPSRSPSTGTTALLSCVVSTPMENTIEEECNLGDFRSDAKKQAGQKERATSTRRLKEDADKAADEFDLQGEG